ARHRADDLVAGHDLGPARRPSVLDRGQAPQVPVHAPARVDAADELLAEKAALRERDRVALQECLLRDRLLVQVVSLPRDTYLDAQGLVRLRPARLHAAGGQPVTSARQGRGRPATAEPSPPGHRGGPADAAADGA